MLRRKQNEPKRNPIWDAHDRIGMWLQVQKTVNTNDVLDRYMNTELRLSDIEMLWTALRRHTEQCLQEGYPEHTPYCECWCHNRE